MSAVDIVILIVLGISTLYGLRNGAMKEILWIAAVVLGILIGILFHGRLGALLSPALGGNRGVAGIVAFMLLFLGAGILVNTVRRPLERMVRVSFVGWIDRLVGMGIGFAKGAFLVSVVLMLVTTHFPSVRGTVKRSRVSLRILPMAKAVTPLLERDLKQTFREQYEELKARGRGYIEDL